MPPSVANRNTDDDAMLGFSMQVPSNLQKRDRYSATLPATSRALLPQHPTFAHHLGKVGHIPQIST